MITSRCPSPQAITRLALGLIVLAAWIPRNPASASLLSQQPTPQPVKQDRLAIPTLPQHPTTIDLGRSVYYYNCMPCHGDRGQGLTDEWRQAWVEDHQNCWERGCHGGRVEDEGFPLPHSIPALIQLPPALEGFNSQAELLAYLRQTHPPQRPGILPVADYQAVTDFLFAENGRLAVETKQSLSSILLAVIFLFAACFLVAGSLIWQTRHPDQWA